MSRSLQLRIHEAYTRTLVLESSPRPPAVYLICRMPRPDPSSASSGLPPTPDIAGSSSVHRSPRSQHDTPPKPVLVLPYRSDPNTALLSPHSGSKSIWPKKTRVRLRSDSGLSLHTNQSAFRQYTGYNPDGSVPSLPRHTPRRSGNGGSADVFTRATPTNAEFNEPASPGAMLPDFFDPVVIESALSNPEIQRRLREFAKDGLGAAHIEFLLKVSLSICSSRLSSRRRSPY